MIARLSWRVKAFLSVMLVFALMTPGTALPLIVEQLASSAPRNVVLFYDDYPTRSDPEFQITREIARPLVAHLDQLGNPTDWMFDSFIFYSQALYFINSPTQDYIRSWIDYLFAGNQVANLDATVAETKIALGQPNYRMNVFLSVPVSINATETPAILKNVDDMLARWSRLQPAHLNLIGFYWGFTEGLDLGYGRVLDESIIRGVADYLHSKSLKLLIIPFLNPSGGIDGLHQMGVDYVTIQPNYAWDQTGDLSRFARVNAAIVAGFADGSEFEFGFNDIACCGGDWRVNTQTYFDQAYGYGWEHASLNTYYHGSPISQMARNSNPDYRGAYETVYQFILNSRGSNLSSTAKEATTQQLTPGGVVSPGILLMVVLPLMMVPGVVGVALTATRKPKLYQYGGYYYCQRHNTPLDYIPQYGRFYCAHCRRYLT